MFPDSFPFRFRVVDPYFPQAELTIFSATPSSTTPTSVACWFRPAHRRGVAEHFSHKFSLILSHRSIELSNRNARPLDDLVVIAAEVENGLEINTGRLFLPRTFDSAGHFQLPQ